MGAEATCRVSAELKVLLETDEIIVRGRVPFSAITDVKADGGRLLLRTATGDISLDLGSAASKWAEKIRSPKSLIDKLGVAKDAVVSVLAVDDAEFLDALGERTAAITKGRVNAGSVLVFLGIERERDLPKIGTVAEKLPPKAALWVVHPKGKDGVPDTAIFAAARENGLTYTKVARFSATHTAERLSRPGTGSSGARERAGRARGPMDAGPGGVARR
jgi:hypothetical protein